MYEIKFTKKARENIQDIKDYISDDNPIIADKMLEKIFYTISNIAIFPNLWKEIGWNLKEFVEPNYKFRIIYKVKNEQIEIEIISIFKNKNLF